MKEQRIFSYDLIKAFAIYLVCLYHFGTMNIGIEESATPVRLFNYFIQGIVSAGVPLFLMVNGALLLNREYDLVKFLNKTAWLFFLYLAWGAITLAALAPVFTDHYSPLSFIKAVYNTEPGRTTHLWFMTALILVYLLFPLVKAFYDQPGIKYRYYLVGLIFVFTFVNPMLQQVMNVIGFFVNSATLTHKQFINVPWLNPFDYDYSFALFYFVLGGLLGKNISGMKLHPALVLVIFLLAAFLLFLFGVLKTNISGKLYDTVYYGYDSIQTLVMSVCVFFLCTKLSIGHSRVSGFISNVSLNTLGIYFIHIPLGFATVGLYKKLSISNNLFADFAYAFLVMIAALVLSMLLRRIPFVRRLVKV